MTRARLLGTGSAVALALTATALWLLREEPPAPVAVRAAAAPESAETREAPRLAPPAPAPAAAPAAPLASARTRGSPLAAELNAPGFDAQHDVATLHAMLRQYLHALRGRQGHPIGNDSDLARVLTGRNPMKLVVLPPQHAALTPDGRLRDRWGTPYFIHPRGRLAFEIRSAGPDRRLFTADDVIANAGARGTDASAFSSIEEPETP